MWGYPNREKGWWIQGGTWSLAGRRHIRYDGIWAHRKKG